MKKGHRKTNRVPCSFKLSPDCLNWLRSQPRSMADILESLIKAEMEKEKNG